MRQATKSSEKPTSGGVGGSKNWSEDDLQLLIKAVNLFPAGTNSRYLQLLNSMYIGSSLVLKHKRKASQGADFYVKLICEYTLSQRITDLQKQLSAEGYLQSHSS